MENLTFVCGNQHAIVYAQLDFSIVDLGFNIRHQGALQHQYIHSSFKNCSTYCSTAYLMHNMIFFSCVDTNSFCNDSLFNAAIVSSSNLLHPVSGVSMSRRINNSIE